MWPFLFVYTPAEAVRKIYPGNPFAEMPDLARRLAEVTRPEDRVFIFGAEPEILFYAQRLSATRYIFLFPLYGPYGDALERQMAAAKEVDLADPAAAIVFPNQLFSLAGSEQFFTRWSNAYLHENFLVNSFLTPDRLDHFQLIPAHAARQEMAPEYNVVGLLLLRKPQRMTPSQKE